MRCKGCREVLEEEYTATGQTICDDCVRMLPVICSVCKEEIIEDEDFPASGDVCADCLDDLHGKELEGQLQVLMGGSCAT